MTDLVSLPFWALVALILFAVIGLADRVFVPSVRWFLRRKANRAIDELNTRLHLRIQPFKTTRRQTLIDQLLFDAEVVQAVEEHARENNVPREVAMQKANRYAREIVPAFNAYAYTAVGTRISRFLSNFIYRVRLGYANDEALSMVDREATVVFVMNHRSNIDYLLVTYLASASATLSYAVGEWARIWVLQSIVRAMGAYFIRRDSGNLLYRRVLARYVHMATRSGVTQAMFPEGGLSRDGHLRDPKFGLLSYMISGFDERNDRDVVFIPVGINYDRVLEDRVLTSALNRKVGERTFQFGVGSVAKFLLNLIKLRLQGKLYSYGYACASFGEPLSLKAWLDGRSLSIADLGKEARFDLIERFGRDLMEDVGEAVPVLPVALVASVFRREGGVLASELELKARCQAHVEALKETKAHLHIARGDLDYAIGAGLRMLLLRHIVVEEHGVLQVSDENRMLLDYYANSISHLEKRL